MRHKPVATLAEPHSSAASKPPASTAPAVRPTGNQPGGRHPPHNGLHLGRGRFLLSLTPQQQDRLLAAAPNLVLGLSSHSLWGTGARRGLWRQFGGMRPDQTHQHEGVPWRPQGTHNLLWWVQPAPARWWPLAACSPPADVAEAAQCGPAAVCVVRGLGTDAEEMAELIPPASSHSTGAPKPCTRPRLPAQCYPEPSEQQAGHPPVAHQWQSTKAVRKWRHRIHRLDVTGKAHTCPPSRAWIPTRRLYWNVLAPTLVMVCIVAALAAVSVRCWARFAATARAKAPGQNRAATP